MDKNEIHLFNQHALARFKPTDVKIVRIATTAFSYAFDPKLIGPDHHLHYRSELSTRFGSRVESNGQFGLELQFSDYFKDQFGQLTNANITGTFQFTFRINNLGDLLLPLENEEKVLAQPILSTLLAISFSTIRGIVADRTANTPFRGYYLPIVDPMQFFKQKETFNSKAMPISISREHTQKQLAELFLKKYPESVVKKSGKDNYLDIVVPFIHPLAGYHIFFNTAKDEIKIGYYCRDDEFMDEKVSMHPNELERNSKEIRLKGNPSVLFKEVNEAIAMAVKLVELIR